MLVKGPQYFGKDLEAMSFAQNYHQWILCEFSPYLGKIVAEVGAGTGNFSKLLLMTDLEKLEAFEPSQNMFPLLEKTLNTNRNARAVNGFFGGSKTETHYDSILYVNVLEHISDDISELANAYQFLKRNGHLLLFVPALPWLFSDFDRQLGHFRRYLKKNLIECVSRAGFNILKVRYFDLFGIIPWYINFVLLKKPMSPGNVHLYDRYFVPLMRPLERLKQPPIGKNLLLIAKKSND